MTTLSIMDEMQTSTPTRSYVVVAWATAVLIGAAIGVALGFILRDPWAGIITGAVVALLVALSVVLAARRAGRGTIESAPTWTGDAGVRH